MSTSACGIAAVDALRAYSWPGNVIELEEVLRWAVVAADRYEQQVIRFEDRPASVRGEDDDADESSDSGTSRGRASTLEAIEKKNILAAADKFGGDRRAMAEELGVSVNTIWRRMRKFGRVREYQKREAGPELSPRAKRPRAGRAEPGNA